MKNILLTLFLMVGLLVSHPELVSGTPQISASPTAPMAIGIVSRTPQVASVLLSDPSAQLMSASLPETSISASLNSSIEATVGETAPVATGNFFSNNWGALLMGLLGFADLITRLTPSVKDNSILNFLSTIINAIIPNLKKGGGTF